MAGRGIDIKLGPGAAEAGGLYVIGTSKNKNKRIDNQLRGRAGRQGDPGRTKYFMSLDDELVRLRYGTNKFDAIKKMYQGTDQRITNKTIISMVQHCQETEESRTKQARRQNEEKEAKVFTRHKKIVYEQRNYDMVMRKGIWKKGQSSFHWHKNIALNSSAISSYCKLWEFAVPGGYKSNICFPLSVSY